MPLDPATNIMIAHSDALVWAIEPTQFIASMIAMQSRDAAAIHQQARSNLSGSRPTIALIDLVGPLMKGQSGFDPFGSSIGTSMTRATEQVNAAVADPSISGILLRIDSPGGTVKGTEQLAAAVFRARQIKPIYAQVEDQALSAAAWIASQATKTFANVDTAMIGSLGVFTAITDISALLDRIGIKVHVIKAGSAKGVGVPGAPVTDEQKAEVQRLIDQTNLIFQRDVARGRGLDSAQIAAIFDGRVHLATDGVGLKLIDGIQSAEQTLLTLVDDITQMPRSSIVAAPFQPTGVRSMFNARQITAMTILGLAANADPATIARFYAELTNQHRAVVDAMCDVAATATVPAAAAVAAAASGGNPMVAAAAAPPAPAAVAPPAPVTPAASSTGDMLSINAERARVTEIHAMGERCSLGSAFVQRHIVAGSTVEVARAAALDALAAQRSAVPNSPVAGGSTYNVGTDRRFEGIGEAFSDALLQRAGTPLYQSIGFGHTATITIDGNRQPIRREAHARAREFAGMGVGEMCRQYLMSLGISTQGMARVEVVRNVMNRRWMAQQAGGIMAVHSTSDFDNILLDAANKSLRTAFTILAPQWQLFCRQNFTPDFKTIYRTQISGVPTPVAVPEGDPFPYVSMSDFKESYGVVKYGQIFFITWEALVNDDLSAFTRIPQAHANACGRLEDDLVFAILTANGNMSDGTALFHANHNNLQASGAAISVVSLSDARAFLRKQTGINSAELLDLRMKFLIVPVAKQTLAEQLVMSLVDPAKNNATPNPFNDQLVVIANPRLDTNSTTKWYGATDPAQMDTIEVSFLEGMRAPQVEEEQGFDIDSRKYKVRHTVGAKALDWRGVFRNDGA